MKKPLEMTNLVLKNEAQKFMMLIYLFQMILNNLYGILI